MQKPQLFVVTKYVNAVSAEEAIKNEKNTPVLDVRPFSSVPITNPHITDSYRKDLGF